MSGSGGLVLAGILFAHVTMFIAYLVIINTVIWPVMLHSLHWMLLYSNTFMHKHHCILIVSQAPFQIYYGYYQYYVWAV